MIVGLPRRFAGSSPTYEVRRVTPNAQRQSNAGVQHGSWENGRFITAPLHPAMV